MNEKMGLSAHFRTSGSNRFALEIEHVLKPETPIRNCRNETTGTTGSTGTTETKPPEKPKRNHQNNRNTRKTRRREPQKVPKVIKVTVSIIETYVSSTNNGRSAGMDNQGPQRSPGCVFGYLCKDLYSN